jgi:glycosyltransferase involved in cell wall biosynthesis
MFDVIHVSPSLDPGHGGPSRTVPALAAAQAALGARVALVTAGPAPADFAQHHPGVALHAFPLLPGPLGSVFRFSSGLGRYLAATPARTIHAHGLWLRPLHHAVRASALHSAPLVLAPRGMLEPWARSHHRWRKNLAATFVHPRAFAAVAGWHATSPQEAQNLLPLSSAPACIAPNGITPPAPAAAAPARAAWLSDYPALQSTRVALFYGRFHQKKRVRELLDLWLSAPRPGWTLLLAGLPGDVPLAELQTLAAHAAATHSIIVADGAPLPQPYGLADLFLLPSHSENFGQAVAEALAAGVPALVTDTLPWRDLNTVRAGQAVPWTDYAAALAAQLARPREALAADGERGRAWVLANFTWQSSARRLLDFYPSLSPARR